MLPSVQTKRFPNENQKNLICVEWPERVESIIPDDALTVEFEFIDEESRRIKTIIPNS